MKTLLHITTGLLLLSLLGTENLSAQKWEDVPDPLSTAQVFFAGTHQGQLWLLDAGAEGNGSPSDNLRMKAFSGSWSAYSEYMEPLADSIRGTRFLSVDSVLYVAVIRYTGGKGKAGLLRFDPRSDVWQNINSFDIEMGVGSYVQDMESFQGDIYLSGNLRNSQGEIQLIRFRPQFGYAEVMGHTNKESRFLCTRQNELLISGDFDSIDNQALGKLIKYDGSDFLGFGGAYNKISFLTSLSNGDLIYLQEDAPITRYLNVQGSNGDDMINGDFPPDFNIRDLNLVGNYYAAIQTGSSSGATRDGVYLYEQSTQRWILFNSELDAGNSLLVTVGKELYQIELGNGPARIQRGSVSRIKGRVFVDIDGDCAPTAGDRDLGLGLVLQDTYSDQKWMSLEQSGTFQSFSGAGTYKITLPALPDKLTASYCTWNDSFVLKSGEEIEVNIPLTVSNKSPDVGIELIAHSGWRVRLGKTESFDMRVFNGGFKFDNCPVTLSMPEEIFFVGADIMPADSGSDNGKKYYTWYVNTAPFDVFTVHFKGWVFSNTPANREVEMEVRSDYSCLQMDNKTTLNLKVIPSKEPNDKQSYPPGELSPETEFIYYHIHFKNPKALKATNVYVYDSLDLNLPIDYFQLTGRSAPARVEFFGRMVKFSFLDINLPDSISDYEGSEGYISFKARLREGLKPGDSIRNTAYIVFDFEDPLETNTVLNKMQLQSNAPITVNRVIRVYPNPALDRFSIENTGDAGHVILLDGLGRKIREWEMDARSTGTFQTGTLSPGLYFLFFPELGHKELLQIR